MAMLSGCCLPCSNGCRAAVVRMMNTYVHNSQLPRLSLAGKVLPPVTKFTPGQLFIHKKLGYCGAVLTSWTAKYFEHLNGLAEASPRPEMGTELSVQRQRLVDASPIAHSARKLELDRVRRFYTVMVDERNMQLIDPRLQSNILSTELKLDCVDHDDIIPIEMIDSQGHETPVLTGILEQQPSLFTADRHKSADGHSVSLMPTTFLQDWLDTHQQAMPFQCQEVHFEITAGFKVTVMPFYFGKQSDDDGVHLWKYWYRIECMDASGLASGADFVTLREHHWNAAQLSSASSPSASSQDERSSCSSPDAPVFRSAGRPQATKGLFHSADYLDHVYQNCNTVRLEKSGGALWGWFRMEARDGVSFNCFMPQFSLAIPGQGSKKKK
eukprot:scpid65977/ scgid14256/ Polymerase delta-interacting protein 2